MTTRTERRRQQTHDALNDLVVSEGLSGATVAAVAARADVAIGTFYNHFDSRDEAIAELATRLAESIDGVVDILLESGGPIATALDQLAAGFLHKLHAEPDWARFMVEVGRTPAWPKAEMAASLGRLVAAGRERGELRACGDVFTRGFLIGAQIRAVLDLTRHPTSTNIELEDLQSLVRAAAGVP